MTYDEAVRYLLALGGELAAPRQPRVAKFDLRNITALAEKLGSPHRAVPCAHIAGTNGKGSTAAMLESILRAAGLRTGLYTSPHLERMNERIAVNGEAISDAVFAAAFTRVHHTIEELLASGELTAHPTFFECVTAMAFQHFANCDRCGDGHPESRQRRGEGSREVGGTRTSGVDFAVYEVGMGGRFDSTNVVQPEVTVITQIDFDHENYLGHSIEAIAGEKAGILKPGVPVVCAAGPAQARAVIARRAAELGAALTDLDEPESIQRTLQFEDPSRLLPVQLPLAGRFQARNALTAVAAALQLRRRGVAIADEAIATGIAQTCWPGRLERIANSPEVWLDGTHNPAGAREVLTFWDTRFAGRKIVLIFGAVRDKALDELTGLLFPRAAHVICTQPRTARAVTAPQLVEIGRHAAVSCQAIRDPGEALARALELAGPDDVVFATGSLYLVGDLRRWWREQCPAVRRGASASLGANSARILPG